MIEFQYFYETKLNRNETIKLKMQVYLTVEASYHSNIEMLKICATKCIKNRSNLKEEQIRKFKKYM